MGGLGSGFRVGHCTLPGGESGCTVVLPPPGNVCAYDMRGSSPGSRELSSLDLERRATEVHGILLTGGSAFGLAAADGVMGWLEEHAVGYRTPLAVIPIVPAAVIFDAAAASGHRRPDAAAGRAACDAAREGKFETGRIGAGAGATVGKWAGREFSVKGGLGMGRAEREGLAVSALVVVNALGDVLDEGGAVIAGTRAPNPRFIAPPGGKQAAAAENTVLAVLAVETQLEKSQARFLAARGSDGITRSVRPAHTRYDGDVVFAVAGRGGPPSGSDLDRLGILASEAVAAAIRDGVRG